MKESTGKKKLVVDSFEYIRTKNVQREVPLLFVCIKSKFMFNYFVCFLFDIIPISNILICK